MVLLAACLFGAIAMHFASPMISARVGVAQVNDDELAAAAARAKPWNLLLMADAAFVCLAGLLIFWKPIKNSINRNEAIGFAAIIVTLIALSGCKPYEVPEYAEIAGNETAFVVPMEGNTNEQGKFDSAEKLNQMKVATKRIRITKRWDQTGRAWFDGQYIPMIRVIKVDRSPVTQSWSKDTKNGIWIESRDSVGFSTGFSITAYIEEPDTAQFLYKYKGGSLSEVMDSEIRARVQSIAAEVAAKYKMDDLRSRKQEIIDNIRADVVPFFKDRGITLSTIGMFGGFEYEAESIQESIDKVFVAQQDKEVAAAQLAAQNDKNETLRLEGIGEAAKIREVAIGRKDAAITVADGESQAIRMIAEATNEASQNPTFLEIKRLEVQAAQIKQWDGRFPQFMVAGGGGQGPAMLLNIPAQQN